MEKVGKMLTEADRKIASEFHRRLAAVVPVFDMVVFGALARGDASVESDTDVFILMETFTSDIHQRIHEKDR
ncbi:MAG: nucleotidyltransferase domain-containing protein [bacterium]